MLKTVLLLVCLQTSLFAEQQFFFNVDPSIGIIYGGVEEIVYRSSISDDYLSRLDWPAKPLVYAALLFDFTWKNSDYRWGLFANTSLKYGLNRETGHMEDRDWVDTPDTLSHYSVSDNITNGALYIALSAGGLFRITNHLDLKAFVCWDFMQFAFTASGGSYLYPPADGGHGNFGNVTAITYEQVWNIISPGVSLGGDFNSYFSGEAAFKISPIVFCSSLDSHLMRNLFVTQQTAWGVFFEPSVMFSFKPASFIKLSLSVSYRGIFFTRGDGFYDFRDNSNPDFRAINMIGSRYSAIDGALALRFTL